MSPLINNRQFAFLMRLFLILITLTSVLTTMGSSSENAFLVGPGTEDLVLRQQEPALYTRTVKMKGTPLLDTLRDCFRNTAGIWRLELDDSSIASKTRILDRRSERLPDLRAFAPLGLYLHPGVNPDTLYAQNRSSKSPGFFKVPLDSDSSPVEFIEAPTYSKAFSKSNSIAVHPSGVVYVSVFRVSSSAKGDPVLSQRQVQKKQPVSVLAYDPKEDDWRPVVWNVPGANGMAVWTDPNGAHHLFLSDYHGNALFKFDASDPLKLVLADQKPVAFCPDNLTRTEDELWIAGQESGPAIVAHFLLSSRIPVWSRIATLDLMNPDATIWEAPVQPEKGPAVATAVPYRDTIFLSQILGREIRYRRR